LAGGGSAKTTVDDVTLVRAIDGVSSTLVDEAASGVPLRGAVIELFAPGTQTPYTRYTLRDVVVAKVVQVGGEETFALHPAEIDEESIAGAPAPKLPAGSQLGTLQLDGYAVTLAVSGDEFEIDGAPSAAGGGSGSQATIKPLVVDLPLGSDSPKLVDDVLAGIHRKTATLTTAHATYSLTDVVVRSLKDEATGAAGSIPSEKIELDAAKVAVATQ
jgi:type VI protein secretion system component Hcp